MICCVLPNTFHRLARHPLVEFAGTLYHAMPAATGRHRSFMMMRITPLSRTMQPLLFTSVAMTKPATSFRGDTSFAPLLHHPSLNCRYPWQCRMIP